MFNKEWSTKKIVLVSLFPCYMYVMIFSGFLAYSLPQVISFLPMIFFVISFYFFYLLTLPFLGIFEKLHMMDSNMFLGDFPSFSALFITALFYSLLLFIILTFISRRVKK